MLKIVVFIVSLIPLSEQQNICTGKIFAGNYKNYIYKLLVGSPGHIHKKVSEVGEGVTLLMLVGASS
jgi:hypothetical protein